MNLNGPSLIVSLIIGSVGFVAFAYGKKQSRLPQMIVGLVLMVFPYFVTSVPWMVGITVALLGGLWGMLRAGM